MNNPIDYEKRNALPQILRYYGIDPRIRVFVVFEGPSELAFVNTWLSEKGLFPSLPNNPEYKYYSDYEVVIVDANGNSGVKSPYIINQARFAYQSGSMIYVIVDADGNKNERINDINIWISEGLLDKLFTPQDILIQKFMPIGGLIWDKCFEDDNFSIEELVTAWKESLSTSKYSQNIIISSVINDIVEFGNNKQLSNIKIMEKLKTQYRVPFNKIKIAEQLALLYSTEDKPIVKLLRGIFTYADRAYDHIYKRTSTD